MRKIEIITMVKASPNAVWAVLTDFSSYPLWEPFVHLSGAAVLGAALTCAVRIGTEWKRVPGDASITQFEEPRRFAWSVGVKPLLLVEERYLISPESEGTRLVHQLEISGWVAGLWRLLMRRYMEATLATVDRSLVERIEKLAGSRGAQVKRAGSVPAKRKRR